MKFRIKERRMSKVKSLKDILPEILKEFKIEDEFSIESLKESWADVVGSIIASHSIPDRIYKHTLFIFADHSVFANEIVMKRNIILEKLNSLYITSNIKNIKTEIKKLNWNK